MDAPIHQACSQCRALKTRCVPDETDPTICERCVRLGRKCFFTPLQKRKPRRTQDQKVAELESEMRRLRILLKQKEASSQPIQQSRDPSFQVGSNTGESNLQSQDDVHLNPALSNNLSSTLLPHAVGVPPNVYQHGVRSDIVDSNAISEATAQLWLERYRANLYPHFPLVYISPNVSADYLRRAKPILFQAVMAGAARTENPALAAQLEQAMLKEYANRVVVNSEKSLELVQSMLVSAVWFQPSKLEKLKFFEYAQMALNMAMDLHIGSDRSKEGLTVSLVDLPAEANWDSRECRRTFLAIYVMSTNLAITFRRTPILEATSYIRECIAFLEHCPEENSADLALTAWARLMMISEEISKSFSYHDHGQTATIVDLKTQHIIKALKKQLIDWRQDNAMPDISPTLMIAYYSIQLYLHEVSLYIDHSPLDFKAPFRVGNVQPCEHRQLPTVALVEAMTELTNSSHAALSIFLNINISTGRMLPVLPFVRAAYSAFVLTKLSESAAATHGGLASFIDAPSIKAEVYLTGVIDHLQQMVGPNECRVPMTFLPLFKQIRQWCISPQVSIDASSGPQGSKSTDYNHVPSDLSNDATPLGSISDQLETPVSSVRSPAVIHDDYKDAQNFNDGHDYFDPFASETILPVISEDHAMADDLISTWPLAATENISPDFPMGKLEKDEWDSKLVPWLNDTDVFPNDGEPASMPCETQ